jgi:hypothetical protein
MQRSGIRDALSLPHQPTQSDLGQDRRRKSGAGFCCVETQKGVLTMQDLHLVTEDQATWLRILERREYERLSDDISVPDHVLNALLQKRLVRRCSDGTIAITLGGIKEVAQH